MKYIPPDDQKELGLNAVYRDADEEAGIACSTVSADVFEMMLREVHNVITMSGITATNDDLTQLYQAIASIDMKWSKDVDYRNPTLVLSSDKVLYTLVKPSGPRVVLPNKSVVGPKEPATSPEYWEKFFISKDTNIIELAEKISALSARLDILEPQVTNAVLSVLQPLIDMHGNNGIATNTTLGHAKPGKGTVISTTGELSASVDNRTVMVDTDNKIAVNSVNVKPALATYTSTGIIIIGEGLRLSGDTLVVDKHSSESSKYGKGSFQDYGHIKLTDDYQSNTDETAGVGISPKGLQTMKADVLGLVSDTVITSSRVYDVPATAVYTITVVGGGGNGGTGGSGSHNSGSWTCGNNTCHSCSASGGTGGGGGGAGETITTTVTLTKGTKVQVTIGGSGGGTTSFGSHATARGGGNGGVGGAGASYGTAAGGGAGGATDSNSTGSMNASCSANGGRGGTGGRSVQGTYGHGGNGGSGGRGSTSGDSGGSGGGAGTQGVCIVSLKLGG